MADLILALVIAVTSGTGVGFLVYELLGDAYSFSEVLPQPRGEYAYDGRARQSQ